jgi:hypothetical protein
MISTEAIKLNKVHYPVPNLMIFNNALVKN